MSRTDSRPTPAAKPAASSSPRSPNPSNSPSKAPPHKRKESARDFIEQIVVALILAFLIRGFEAEAFVIPTGSMAPTLMGQHKELTCPQCGYQFTLNASSEENAPLDPVVRAVCGNCRAPFRCSDAPTFKGDRILVNKFLYAMPFLPGGGKPERWNVIVFHFPEKPEMNYIKRLVGLPDEQLRIWFGDVHTARLGSQDYQIERKPLGHQQAMQMHVWDDRHRPRLFADHPAWNRWQPRVQQAWVEAAPAVHSARGSNAGPANAWNDLLYQHLIPDQEAWAAADSGRRLPDPRPSLITDYYAYNMGMKASGSHDFHSNFVGHWVGDLTLGLKLKVDPHGSPGAGAGGAPRFRVQLIEAGIPHAAVFDLSSGEVVLLRGERELARATPAVNVGDGRDHAIEFANVDDRLTLWIDGKTIFGEGVNFARDKAESRAPTVEDLAPARVGVAGDASVAVSNLLLKRDIYYTLDPRGSDYIELGLAPYLDSMSDVTRFPLIENLRPRDFAVRPGHFFMMGDNSPRSADSRGWSDADQIVRDPQSGEVLGGWDPEKREAWELPESLLVGKAFFVYWPHGVPFWPEIAINRDFRIPFRPYFERMRWIR
jgi:signal peptidase I